MWSAKLILQSPSSSRIAVSPSSVRFMSISKGECEFAASVAFSSSSNIVSRFFLLEPDEVWSVSWLNWIISSRLFETSKSIIEPSCFFFFLGIAGSLSKKFSCRVTWICSFCRCFCLRCLGCIFPLPYCGCFWWKIASQWFPILCVKLLLFFRKSAAVV